MKKFFQVLALIVLLVAVAYKRGLATTLICSFSKETDEFNVYTRGPFRRVHEEKAFIISSDKQAGKIPKALLKGSYLTIGPSPIPGIEETCGVHWWDKQGVVHAFSFTEDGRVHLDRHFPRTEQYYAEKKAGRTRISFLGVFAAKYSLLNTLKLIVALVNLHYFGPSTSANTDFNYFGGDLFAQTENHGAFSIGLEKSPEGFVKVFSHGMNTNFTQWWGEGFPVGSHSFRDSRTDELLVYGMDGQHKHTARYGIRSKESSSKTYDLPFIREHQGLSHTSGFSENFMILFFNCHDMDPARAFQGKPVELPHDPECKVVYNIAPRKNLEKITSITSTSNIGDVVHFANAYDDGSVLTMYVVGYEDTFSLSMFGTGDLKNDFSKQHLWKIVLDINSGKVLEEKKLMLGDGMNYEFPQVSPKSKGYENAPIYAFEYDHSIPLQDFGNLPVGLVKIQNDEIVSGFRLENHEKFTLELQVVDEKYLIMIAHNFESDESELRVYDGASMSKVPLFSADLGTHIPGGFHSLWLEHDEINRIVTSSETLDRQPI